MSEFQGNTEIKMGSDRSFGLVFSMVFLLVSFFPLFSGGRIRIWELVVSLIFMTLAIFSPRLLQGLNFIWFRFGLYLNKFVSPLIMGIVFFFTVTPIGLLMKLRNKDLLNERFDASKESYWIPVDPMDGAKSSMRNQF